MKPDMRPGKFFYGWYIVIVAFWGHFIGTGTGFYIFNAFLNPLCEARGWSRTEFNAAPGIGYITMTIGALILGLLLKRISIRMIMVCGAIVSGVAFTFLGQVKSIWLYYAVFIVLSFGNSAMSGIVANSAVSNWFVKKRGNALGMANAGISFSGVILPYTAMVILIATDIETAFFSVGLLIFCIAPLAWFLVKDTPEDYGLTPDGINGNEPLSNSGTGKLESVEFEHSAESETDWDLPSLMREKTFWKMGIGYGLMLICISPVMFQLAPRFISIGFSRKEAMLMLTFTALMGTLGKYAWGMLCDRFNPLRVVALNMVVNSMGVMLALFADSMFALVLFMISFGFSMGGVMSTHPIMAAYLFGRKSFVVVYKYLVIFLAFQISGYMLMGLSFDYTGSYNTAYTCFIFTSLLAAGLIFSIKGPVYKKD
jgi:OFA family oxalate/formate antiporter-like MFS transporter